MEKQTTTSRSQFIRSVVASIFIVAAVATFVIVQNTPPTKINDSTVAIQTPTSVNGLGSNHAAPGVLAFRAN